MDARRWERWTGLLGELPVSARLMLTAFLAIVGAGYLVATVNIYERHGMADGKPGLTVDDIRAVYSGMTVRTSGPATSRMLTMVLGGMRQYVSSEEDFATLTTWLKAGGSEAGLDGAGGKDETRQTKTRTARRVLVRDCLRCHSVGGEGDIAKRAPFGKDEFDIEYAMIAKYAAAPAGSAGERRNVGPQYDLPRLVLMSHQHMLAIPVFTLIVGGLFLCTRIAPRWRAVLLPLPMLASVVDFSGWWLARVNEGFVYAIAAAGGVFGVGLGLQIVLVLLDMWGALGRRKGC